MNKIFYNLTDVEELIKCYESLRTSVLDKSYFNSIYNSSVIFLRGMAAWINTFSTVEPIKKTQSNLSDSIIKNNITYGSCKQELNKEIYHELTTILTNIICSIRLEK